MMDCKAALAEAGGDMDKAIDLLRVKAGVGREARRTATGEGVVASRIHATGKVGVLVEVGCETDFVARTDEVREFAREVAVHRGAAPPPQYVSKDEIPAGVREAERRVLEQRAREDGKPTTSSTRSSAASSAEAEVALLDQEHINSDRYDGKTIEPRTEIASKTGRTSPSPACPVSRSGGVVADAAFGRCS